MWNITEVYLGHDGAQVEVVRLRYDPVRVARQRPAGDGAHQRLALGQAHHQVRHQVRQVRHHAAHAAVRHRAQRQDAALLRDRNIMSHGTLCGTLPASFHLFKGINNIHFIVLYA